MAVSGGRSWARPGLETGKMPAWKLEVLERKRAKMGSVPPARDGSPRRGRPQERGPEESLVLQDSLGPLNENPFMKKEKERRRRWGPHHSPARGPQQASPIRHLLDMYSNVPGIRTIRAENIIIIESDPTYFTRGPAEEGAKAHRDPMEELLAKRGSKVAEIRASEVVIYETEPPAKAAVPGPLGQEGNAMLEEAGRVSRLLERFNQGPRKPARSRSWDLLDGDSRPPKPKPPPMPKPGHIERHGQAPVIKAPRRSGERSPSPASALDEDSKRFPLNNPAWMPSKPTVVHSVPNPGLFHKKPTSPSTTPAVVLPVSMAPVVVGQLSPHYETSTYDKISPPAVASFIEKFEVGSSHNNLPLPKFVTQKTGKNTIVVNPKAAQSHNLVRQEPGSGMTKPSPPLVNGHIQQSSGSSTQDGPLKIEDLLSKSRQNKGAPGHRVSEGGGKVPSTASGSKKETTTPGAKNWGPKYDVDHGRPIIAPESSASKSDSSIHCEQSFSSATPSQQNRVVASTSSNDSFEIRPAPKPDLKNIPENDVQAKALANIRMQSKNSFIFVPKKRQQVPSEPKQEAARPAPVNKPKVKASAPTVNGPKADYTDSPHENGIQSSGTGEALKGDTFSEVERVDRTVTQKASAAPALSDFDWKSGLLPSHSEGHSFTDIGAELEYISSVHHEKTPEASPVPVTKLNEDVVRSDIPVTNIDDLVNHEASDATREAKPDSKGVGSSVPSYRPHASLSSVRNKAGNTFTVVPKRKPITEQEAFRTPVIEEEEEDDNRSKRKSSDGNDAPYSDLGALLKKRYPTADEIQVIGGYLSLSKSCLSKNGSTRKKMKISFNEQNIHTLFEYPSETSLAEDDESNEGSDSDDKPSSPFLPRAKSTSSGAHPNPANSGLSRYTPKHSMDFSDWQEGPSTRGRVSGDGAAQQDDMLTPADSSSLSDFRSEPALYF